MESGVCEITNNFNGLRGKPEIEGEGIFHLKKGHFTMEGKFKVNEAVEEVVGIISFQVKDVVIGNNQDMLLFSGELSYSSIGNNNSGIPSTMRDIWYLKLKNGLSEEEEKFLRDYNRMSNSQKIQVQKRYLEIQGKIQAHIVEERERIMHLLNSEKGTGGELELF